MNPSYCCSQMKGLWERAKPLQRREGWEEIRWRSHRRQNESHKRVSVVAAIASCVVAVSGSASSDHLGLVPLGCRLDVGRVVVGAGERKPSEDVNSLATAEKSAVGLVVC